MRSDFSKNLKFNILIAGQFIVAAFFIFRLFQIQVLQHDKYKAMAEDQYWSVQEIPAKRGDILSKDGYPLATTTDAYLLYAQPGKITNVDVVANTLAGIVLDYKQGFYDDENQREALFRSYRDRYAEVLNLNLQWVALEHYLPEKAKNEIANLNIDGIGFENEPRRYYPEGTLASHVLGFVAKNKDGTEQGYFGIEGSLNGDLQGKPGRIIQENDAAGNPILIGEYNKVEPIEGADVVLTINRAVQYLVEKKLKEGVENYGAISGSVIVMDPSTGDVIAMANYPTYHPGRFNEDLYNDIEGENEIELEEKRSNSAIMDAYEPGSVMKPVTVASAIDLGLVSPKTTFEDNGPVYYSGYKIDNWDGKHHGTQTIIQLLQKSNNIGAAWVGHQVGSKNLHKYLEKFGFGAATGIGLEGENLGILRPHNNWTDIDLANAAFGQGVSATPLQVLNAFNTIANGGNLVRPRIVYKLDKQDDDVMIPVDNKRRVISKDTAATMDDMLEKAVAGGESKYFNIENYRISGKTGTAQIAIDGEYTLEETNATFAGYLTESKKFSMIVRLNRPAASSFASETAVPLWMGIAESLVNYYGIPPDK